MKKEYTITVYTEDNVGILGRLSNIFSRRKINIDNLNTAMSEVPGIHRFTIVVRETQEAVAKLMRQIDKQVDVLKSYFHTSEDIIWQEVGLYKVAFEAVNEKAKVEQLLNQFGAKPVSIANDYAVFQATGHHDEIDRVIKFFEPYGLIEFVRGARVAIHKDSATFHSELKTFNHNN